MLLDSFKKNGYNISVEKGTKQNKAVKKDWIPKAGRQIGPSRNQITGVGNQPAY